MNVVCIGFDHQGRRVYAYLECYRFTYAPLEPTPIYDRLAKEHSL